MAVFVNARGDGMRKPVLRGEKSELRRADLVHSRHVAGDPDAALAATVNALNEVAGQTVIGGEARGFVAIQADQSSRCPHPESSIRTGTEGMDVSQIFPFRRNARYLSVRDREQALRTADPEHAVLIQQ